VLSGCDWIGASYPRLNIFDRAALSHSFFEKHFPQMKPSRRLCLGIVFSLSGWHLAGCAPLPASSPAPAVSARSDWTLVWSDEFDRDGLPDTSRWNYDVGGDGWGNHELQFYTAARRENARIENGHLVIEARREAWKGKEYTSARLTTKGHGDWSHGRFDIRAKLPDGRGTWRGCICGG